MDMISNKVMFGKVITMTKILVILVILVNPSLIG
jgi:hypothetical protein